jgi:phosphoribosylformylglycinamidine (FGAM) synthase PurS component
VSEKEQAEWVEAFEIETTGEETDIPDEEITRRIRKHLVNAHINNYEARAEEWQEIGHTEIMEASR